MTTKNLNTYRLTFKDGTTERINAAGLVEAIENASKDDADTPIVQTFMVAEQVATVVQDLPKEVLFTAVVAGEAGGSIATPASGSVHVGDTLTLQAVPDKGWLFHSWKRNGHFLSHDAVLLYEMKPLAEGEDTCVFTATFRQEPRKCVTSVSPAQATGDGCMAFPSALSVLPGEEVSAVAVTQGAWKFLRWERDGEKVGTNIVLSAEATQDLEQEYVAVFGKEGEDNGENGDEPKAPPVQDGQDTGADDEAGSGEEQGSQSGEEAGGEVNAAFD